MYTAAQEMQVYAASLPFMVAAKARANAEQMNDHGPLHAQRVHFRAEQLTALFALSEQERSLVLAAALLHDIGMAKDRATHHVVAYDTVLQLSKDGKLPFDALEADIVATLCLWHRKEYVPAEVRHDIRLGLLASILRLADAMDIDYRRSDDYPEREPVISAHYQSQVPHHQSVRNLLALRLVANKIGAQIELFVNDASQASLQIVRLIEELMATPVRWPVKLIPTNQYPTIAAPEGTQRKAVIFAYCNPHGMVQAGVSKRQLSSSGFETTIVCDAKRTSDPQQFWQTTVPQYCFDDTDLVVVIDLELPSKRDETLSVIRKNQHCRWLYGTPLALSHESVEALRAVDVDVVLADERALFAGTSLDSTSLSWLKISGLCNFDDPLVWHNGISKSEHLVSRGLRYALWRLFEAKAGEEEYCALCDRVWQDDRAYFEDLGTGWEDLIEKMEPDVERKGRALICDKIPLPGRFVYDVIRKSIEKQGLQPYGQNELLTPIAIHRRTYYGKQSVLFLSHYIHKENAIPARYFISPRGREFGKSCTIWQTFENEDDAKQAIEETVQRVNEALS